MKILTINGIRTDGSASTDKLGGELSRMGFDVVDVNYPKVNILTARSRNRQYKNAQYLVNKANDGDVLIAHSYGGLLARVSMLMGARYSHVFLFAPAMDKDFIFPYLGATKIHIIYNKTDKAIKMGNLLWFHDFGKMGSHGCDNKDEDPRIENIEDEMGTKGGRNHSHYFSNKNVESWAEYIQAVIK